MTTQSSPTGRLSRLLPLAILLASANLYAESPISTSLTGAAEVPAVTTAASGQVNISIQPNRAVSGSIQISGMVPTVAHIHEGPVGKNGPPIITLTKKSDKLFTVPADAKLSEAQHTSYLAGNLYINVHSAAYPNGEIRAQLPGKPMRIAY
ncbi:CHRD domain-containing protein [Azonexus hydrophilus]|uniref:CHRD domain-containing protein n=1 Tax=Azonexus hydrophilus TaxID=418702 RepID=A0A1R1HZF3_9RHOO|nr:CHRD domain-containing protein [Azonexus hydrophilus]OMG51885.1 CHRD domain-containing protein [Azonexus hydrophilus]